MLKKQQLLTTSTMALADSETISHGISGVSLMEHAGNCVTQMITEHNNPKPTLVICGPGNNGGDGWVVARKLQQKKWPVKILSLVPVRELKGDAAHMARHWNGPVHNHWDKDLLDGVELVIDAVFGIGLSRPIESDIIEIIDAVNSHGAPIISIDMPSGINADSGEVMGAAFKASLTVTFGCKKIGHLLLPGKAYCKLIAVTDIGIPIDIINKVAPPYYENIPELWQHLLPRKRIHMHKYDRGHVVVVGGPAESTGASRLSAISALRSGAGLVTILCPTDALSIYASQLTSVMVKPCDFSKSQYFDDFINDKYKNTILIGPGAGINENTKNVVLTALKHHKKCVLDADALTIFRNNPNELFNTIESDTILTPHEGEFERLFGKIKGTKLERAMKAAKKAHAIIVLKGNDTIIASPDGTTVINSNATPYLATAGSGDVLAGIIAGFVAQGTPALEAACIGVWVHGEAGNMLGRGLIAEDLANILPKALSSLYK